MSLTTRFRPTVDDQFTPTTPYPANATVFYYSNYFGTITDGAGNPAASTYQQFTTANVEDTTGPAVTSVTPVDGASAVGLSSEIVLTFSESMNPQTLHDGTLAV